MGKFKTGKIEPHILSELFSGLDIRDERVKLTPAVGEDVCAISMGDNYLVAKTDPITFANKRIGWYVVHINANDIATSGADPKWFLVTALLPEKSADKNMLNRIWDDLNDALELIGCTLCGGHTEVTVGLDRPLLIGHMLGEVPKHKLIDKSNMRPGDRLLLTKGVPVEGTAIIANEKPDLLKNCASKNDIKQAQRFLDTPGISVVKEARIACRAGGVHAMHDPTEGGLTTGLWELAQAGNVGLKVHENKIPFVKYGELFCKSLGLDPLGTIASGALIICVEKSQSCKVLSEMMKNDILCADIGEVTQKDTGIKLIKNDGSECDMPVFTQDEISKLWS